MPCDGGFLIALPYGQTDWCRNVLAAGRAVMVQGGGTFGVHRPELVDMAEVRSYFSPGARLGHALFRVRQCLRVQRS